MNSTKRYLPLSLALVLVCSVQQDARANSALDPYAHVKAPQGAKKQSAAIPSVDAITTPSTYVTMPMGSTQNANKQGIVGTMMSTITAPHKSIKKASSTMVSGTKSAGANIVKGGKFIGDGFAKSAGVIGQGIKSSSDKLVGGTQAVGSTIAKAVPGGGPRNTPQRQSISGMYEQRAAQELAKVDKNAPKSKIASLVEDSKDKEPITAKTFLSLKHKPKTTNNKMPDSGFYSGAVAAKAKQDQQEALKKVQPQNQAKQAPKTIAAKPAAAPSSKKWTNGFGLLKKPKLNKPTIGKGLFGKKAPQQKQAVPTTQVAKAKDLKPTPAQAKNPAVAAKPQATPSANQAPVTQTPVTHVSNMTQEKQGRFGKLTKIGFGKKLPKLKLNPFAKSKAPAPQTATKQAAPKKDLQL